MSGYEVFEDPYCYPDTFILKNKANIRRQQRLDAFELEMTTLRADEPLPGGKFGPPHYCKIHKHLFQDVYTWAGKYRTVRTAKGGNPFCFPENIDASMKRLFERLKADEFRVGVAADTFVRGAADFLAELNAIHPFREGNGRSQLAFMHLVALRAEHPLDFNKIDRDTFLPAMIASYAGNLAQLEAELTRLLQ